MNKHSPGPWKTEGPPINFFTEVVDAKGLLVAKACTREDDGFDAEELRANLRLILKAPELLAVVRGWVGESPLFSVVSHDDFLKARALLKEIDGKEKEEPIDALEGVSAVYPNPGRNRYCVYLDPRYDRDEVKTEIEALIMGG